MHGHQHSFLTEEWMFLKNSQSFYNRKYLTLGGHLNPNLRIYAEYSIHFDGREIIAMD